MVEQAWIGEITDHNGRNRRRRQNEKQDEELVQHELENESFDFFHRPIVEARRDLIEQQHIQLVDERPGNGDPAPFPARQRLD